MVVFMSIAKSYLLIFNSLSANGELSCHESLTFLWTWILDTEAHASL